jgi:hypothetical protein
MAGWAFPVRLLHSRLLAGFDRRTVGPERAGHFGLRAHADPTDACDWGRSLAAWGSGGGSGIRLAMAQGRLDQRDVLLRISRRLPTTGPRGSSSFRR